MILHNSIKVKNSVVFVKNGQKCIYFDLMEEKYKKQS